MFKCPKCGDIIYNRRLGKCVSCKAPLPESMQMTEKQKQHFNKLVKTQKGYTVSNNSANIGSGDFFGDFGGGDSCL